MQTGNQDIGADVYFNRTSHSNPLFVDDNTIAYLDDSSGTNQLFLLDTGSGQSERVTDYSEGILTLSASKASGIIMFGIDQNGDERQQLYTLTRSQKEPLRITHDDSAFFEPGGFSHDGKTAVYRTNSRDETIFDVAVGSVDGTSSEIWLKNGGQVLPQDLSEKGTLVIASKGNSADDLLLVQADENVRNLTGDLDEHRIYRAVFDPSGSKLWILSELGREHAALFSYDLASSTFEAFYEADWEIELVSVSPDGNYLALSINENGYSVPLIVSTADASQSTSIECPPGVIDGFSWSPDSQHVVFGLATSETPSRIYTTTLDGRAEAIGSKEESSPVPTVAATPVHFRTWDGRDIPAYLYLPESEGPHAALVEIHGGPESQRRPGYGSTGASIQYFVSQGIAVLALNIRGSIGYGREYRHLDDKEKRLDALKDVEAAAKWLAERDDIDAEKIGVFGISYGGFMTLSAVTRLPQIWAAGAEMVGMAHLETFLERTGPWRRKHREGEYGSLEHDREMLRAVSPLPLVDQIASPLLVLHGRNDARVPLYESEQIVEAVSSRGIPVDLVIYDDEGHIFSKRKNLIDAYTRIGEFLKTHLQV